MWVGCGVGVCGVGMVGVGGRECCGSVWWIVLVAAGVPLPYHTRHINKHVIKCSRHVLGLPLCLLRLQGAGELWVCVLLISGECGCVCMCVWVCVVVRAEPCGTPPGASVIRWEPAIAGTATAWSIAAWLPPARPGWLQQHDCRDSLMDRHMVPGLSSLPCPLGFTTPQRSTAAGSGTGWLLLLPLQDLRWPAVLSCARWAGWGSQGVEDNTPLGVWN